MKISKNTILQNFSNKNIFIDVGCFGNSKVGKEKQKQIRELIYSLVLIFQELNSSKTHFSMIIITKSRQSVAVVTKNTSKNL